MNVPTNLVLPLASFAMLGFTGCAKKDAAQQGPPPPAQVEVYVTKSQTIPVSFEHTGQIEASQQVDVRARVTGILLEQGFTEGTTVTKGQYLFRIDPRTFEADVRIGSANVLQAQAAVQSAEREMRRTRQLATTRAVAQEEVDTAITKYETAAAAQKLAEANLYKAQVEHTYTTVTAPITGKVGTANKRTGDLVDDGENSLLCTITTQEPIWVVFFISEREMLEYNRNVAAGKIVLPADGKVRVGVTLLDRTPYPHTGEISFFDVKINPQTGTAMVRAELANPQGMLVPGQFVKAHVRGATRPNVVLVPQGAVQQGMQGSYVYVIDEKSVVEMRPVTVGRWEGQSWIIETGLHAGEKVVTGGLLKVRPGASVDVTTVTRELPTQPIASTLGQVSQTTRTASRSDAGTTDSQPAR